MAILSLSSCSPDGGNATGNRKSIGLRVTTQPPVSARETSEEVLNQALSSQNMSLKRGMFLEMSGAVVSSTKDANDCMGKYTFKYIVLAADTETLTLLNTMTIEGGPVYTFGGPDGTENKMICADLDAKRTENSVIKSFLPKTIRELSKILFENSESQVTFYQNEESIFEQSIDQEKLSPESSKQLIEFEQSKTAPLFTMVKSVSYQYEGSMPGSNGQGSVVRTKSGINFDLESVRGLLKKVNFSDRTTPEQSYSEIDLSHLVD